MQIRRFEAKDVQEALRQVKETLGPEAIILSTKTIRGSSPQPGWAKTSMVEVVAAMDFPETPQRKAAPEFYKPSFSSLPAKREEPRRTEDPFVEKVLSLGLYPAFARSLAEELGLLRKEFRGGNAAETYRGFVQMKLMEAIEVAGPELKGNRIWAFVGPTGVGKTTTLAKLAAYFSLGLRKRITLVTIDTYRIGAVEQLRTYARILRLPLEIAPDPESFKQVIANHRQQDLLLVDTPGGNPYRTEKLEALRDFLATDPRIENHLVLSATTKEFDLAQVVEHFRFLPMGSYIFTKIDETVEYVSLFNQLLRYKKPLSFFTHGQRVPEDLELATKGKMASLIMKSLQWN